MILFSGWEAGSSCLDSTPAVVPVIAQPLAVLMPILVGFFLVVLRKIIRLFTPRGMKDLVLLFWHQKVFTGCLMIVVAGWWAAAHYGLIGRSDKAGSVAKLSGDWPAFRGDPQRTGAVRDGQLEPSVPTPVWNQKPSAKTAFKTFYSSPAVIGNRVFVASVDYGPMTDRGAIFCLDASADGKVVWSYNDGGRFRSTFSSPSVWFKKDKDAKPTDEGYLACGEGLHMIADARVTCLRLKGDTYEKLWDYRTKSHVESSPAIHDGKVYVGAGDDGYYCFKLEPKADGTPEVVWHKTGQAYRDCETSPVVAETIIDGKKTPVCYVGLGEGNWKDGGRGEGGKAVVALHAETGAELWRIDTPCPVFAPATVIGGRLYVAMGNGNFVQGGEAVKQERLKYLREQNVPPDRIAAIAADLGDRGEVWCIKPPSAAGRQPKVEWQFKTKQTILSAVAYRPEQADANAKPADEPAGKLYFGSLDGWFYCIDANGKLVRKFNARSPISTSPTVGENQVYFATRAGTLFCLSADDLAEVWQTQLGLGAMFCSSPVLADGKIFIGTDNEGFRCIGGTTPPVPQWTNGHRGGQGDRSPVVATGTRHWTFPRSPSPDALKPTAPLMPLSQQQTQADIDARRQAARYVYVPTVRDGKPALLKIEDGIAEVRRGPRKLSQPAGIEVWAVPFERIISVAPLGLGDDLYVVEGGGSSDPARLHLLRARDGASVWRADLAIGASGQSAIAPEGLAVWSGPTQLSLLDRTTGRTVWSHDLPGSRSAGAPLVFDGFVLAATDRCLALVEIAAQAELWRQELDEPPLFGPLLGGRTVVLATANGVQGRSVFDGQPVWACDTSQPATLPAADEDKVVVINQDGQLHMIGARTGQWWRLAQKGMDIGLVRVESAEQGGAGPGKPGSAGAPSGQAARAAPTPFEAAKVATCLPPMTTADKVIFSAPDGDLMCLRVPADWLAELEQPTGRRGMINERPRLWLNSDTYGPARTPLVFAAGRGYYVAEDAGLVCIRPEKR